MSEDVKNVLDEQFENEIEDTVVEVDDEEIDLEELSNEELIDIIRGLSYELDKKDDSEQRVNEFALEREKVRAMYEDSPVLMDGISIKNSKEYYTQTAKNVMDKAIAIGESFQILIKYGIDVVNAISIANNLIQNEYNIKMAEIQDIKQL